MDDDEERQIGDRDGKIKREKGRQNLRVVTAETKRERGRRIQTIEKSKNLIDRKRKPRREKERGRI